MRQDFANRYLTDKVSMASPAELIGMLYDTGVTALHAARAASDAGQAHDVHRHLVRAQDVVLELRSSLDLSTGDLAHRLDSLYGYLHRRLVEANLRKDDRMINEGIDILSPLRDTWREACLGRSPVAVA